MLAAATLLLESTLTRLLAVAQFYHFAFLAVSLALLGFGAGGALLSAAPALRRMAADRLLLACSLGFAAAVGLAYAVINLLPFDSYSIAWDRRQLILFGGYYLALTLPFLCSGLGIAAALAGAGRRRAGVYAANLLGSAGGAGLALATMRLAGVPGAVLGSALIGLAAALWLMQARPHGLRLFVGAIMTAGVIGSAWLAGLNLRAGGSPDLGMTISPYKGLAHARRVPGAAVVFGRWDEIGRVDVVAGAGTRGLPGLSYTYAGAPPPQLGLAHDADALLPITLAQPADFAAGAYLPEALAFELRPHGRTLILEAGGGLGVLQALAAGVPEIVAVNSSSLERQAIAAVVGPLDPYAGPRVHAQVASPRVFLAGDRTAYDVIFLPLTDPYRPVTSGAYSLGETYGLTVEAFEAMLARLTPDGLLVVTRWLQTPPSEGLRLIATLATALERRGAVEAGRALLAYRGIQTLTAIVRPAGWQPNELAQARQFIAGRRYDLVWAPDIRDDETNRFNRLPRPADYEATAALLATADRRAFYADYPFAITPPTDDRPFFFHFFRWGQMADVVAGLGHTWQPFGGSGYLVLLALLGLVLLLSAGLIAAPALLAQPVDRAPTPGLAGWRLMVYFGSLGLAFLFVEIPLIQRSILLFGHPTYAFSVVVILLLLCASLGAQISAAVARRPDWICAMLVLIVTGIALAGPRLAAMTLGWSSAGRLLALVVALAPPAILMGMPFPLGLAATAAGGPRATAWAWTVNGCASVVSAVLAALIALSWGFTAVLLLGAAAYAVAGLMLSTGGTTRPIGSRPAPRREEADRSYPQNAAKTPIVGQ